MKRDGLVEALFVFWICGSSSLLLGVGHIVALLSKGMHVSLYNLSIQTGRPLHIPVLVITGIVCIVRGAFVARLFVNTNKYKK